MPPFPSNLQFGSFAVYPRPTKTQPEQDAKAFILTVKKDGILPGKGSAIKLIVNQLKQEAPNSCLANMLDGRSVLVPTPGSGRLLPKAVWASRSICEAMVEAGLGSSMAPLVERVKSVPKSAWAAPGERPTPLVHYQSMKVKSTLLEEPPESIILVDDVLTKGATFSGAAARLAEAFPNAEILAFAIARTDPMVTFIDPRTGYITCWADGGNSSR